MNNETSYGLGASIYTADIEKARQMAARLDCGSVFINDLVKSGAGYPFGGVKNSGYGRELSYFGLHEFTNIQTVFVGS
ncbi:MAG: aldehyde dehydrogenase family protein [Cyclobacteriaceae bacterium]